MKIYVRDAQTRLLMGAQGWTSELAEAISYGTVEAAAEAAMRFPDQDLCVMLRYGEPPGELLLSPAFCLNRKVKPLSRKAG